LFGGLEEIGFLLFVGFLLFGPKKLPEIARTLGKGMAELRRASNELKGSLEEELRNLERQTESPDQSRAEGRMEGRTEGRTEGMTGAVPKNGDHDSEPTPDESRTRT